MKSFLLLFAALISTIALASDQLVTLKVSEIESGVYLHTSYKNIEGFGRVDSHGMVVVDEKNAYIIDTPWSEVDTQALLHWVSAKGLSIRASISTHFHDDRAAGIGIMNLNSIPTYASKLTNQLLQDKGAPIAANTFESNEFVMSEIDLEVFYPGAGHSEDNVVVWFSEKKILFGGCLVRSQNWNSLGNTSDADVENWASSVKKIKSNYPDIRIVIPGHGEIGDVRILDHTIEVAERAQGKLMQANSEAANN